MGRFVFNWAVMALALWATAWILPGVHVQSTPALLIGALALGFVNAVIRPVMTLLTLPITIVTLGLFYLVVNGIAFAMAAALVPGFSVDGFGWSMLGALCASLISWFVGSWGAD